MTKVMFCVKRLPSTFLSKKRSFIEHQPTIERVLFYLVLTDTMPDVNPAKNFVSGGIGGICCVVAGQPFDTIKVRIQTMPTPKPGEKPLFTGAFDCVKQTVKKEGGFALYKGMGAPLTGVAPIFAIYFFGTSIGRKLQSKYEGEVLSIPKMFNAGCMAGFMTTLIMAPAERVKCLLQVQRGAGTGAAQYSGPLDVLKQLYKQGGIRSIYRGTFATLARDVPASGMYLGSYEFLMRTMSGEDRQQLSPLKTLFAGGLAGICNWSVAVPQDVLKSRLQIAPEGKYPNGIRDVLKELLAKEGPMALYKGFTPIMLRAFPANAACFFGYETAMKTFTNMGWN